VDRHQAGDSERLSDAHQNDSKMYLQVDTVDVRWDRDHGLKVGGLSLLRQASVAHCSTSVQSIAPELCSATPNEDLKISLLREDGVQTASTKVQLILLRAGRCEYLGTP
jgi:hypothetical protein